MTDFKRARELLDKFKGDLYLFGPDVLLQADHRVAAVGKEAVLIRGTFTGNDNYVEASIF